MIVFNSFTSLRGAPYGAQFMRYLCEFCNPNQECAFNFCDFDVVISILDFRDQSLRTAHDHNSSSVMRTRIEYWIGVKSMDSV